MSQIASKTPEGNSAFCPVCNRESLISASTFPLKDATCPHCGSWLLIHEDFDNEIFLTLMDDQKNGDFLLDNSEFEKRIDGLTKKYQNDEKKTFVFLDLTEITNPMEIGEIERDWAEYAKANR